jgi:F0F1-type ATP synthase assembly protein I
MNVAPVVQPGIPVSNRRQGARVDLQDPTQRKIPSGGLRQAAVAYSLPFTLIVPPVVAGGAGYLLDRWLHKLPLFTIVLGLVGFGIGLRDILKAASRLDKKDGG